MTKKKSPEALYAERDKLITRIGTDWVHKKSGRTCKIVENTVECNSNEWYVVYEFQLVNRFPTDMFDSLFDLSSGLRFTRAYSEFIEKFERLTYDGVKLTKKEYDLLRKNQNA